MARPPCGSSREVPHVQPHRGYCRRSSLLSMTTARSGRMVSFLTRYSGHNRELYSYQLRRWFTWCQTNGPDPLTGIQRAHVEHYIRNPDEAGPDGVFKRHDARASVATSGTPISTA